MMIDPALKVAMAFCVLLGGVCAAMMFRRDAPRPAATTSADAEQLRIRSRRAASAPVVRPQAPPENLSDERRVPEAFSDDRPAVIVKPLNRRQSPPPSAPTYPEADRAASSRWGASMDMMLPAKETNRTHRIVDGDTLEGLADLYLGSAARAQEIFDTNRDVLSDPKLLPIGTELKIPPTVSQQSQR